MSRDGRLPNDEELRERLMAVYRLADGFVDCAREALGAHSPTMAREWGEGAGAAYGVAREVELILHERSRYLAETYERTRMKRD